MHPFPTIVENHRSVTTDPRPGPAEDDDQTNIEADIATYLATGHQDPGGWAHYAGSTVFESMQRQGRALRSALIAKVEALGAGHKPPPVQGDMTTAAAIKTKLEPMVYGLFPLAERELVIGLVMRSVVFLDRDAAFDALEQETFLHSAWDIARIWLGSIGAEPLSEHGGGLLGLSQGTTCYVSLEYFDDLQRDPFCDYIVHEAPSGRVVAA